MSFRPSLAFAAAALFASLAFGCAKKESVDSQDVTTHGMSLELQIVNDGTNDTVEAGLHVGSFESLVWARLSTGDELVLADPKGDKRALGVVNSSGKTVYGATLPAADGEFVLDFLRSKGASALGNKVLVPPSFALTAPASASRKEALTFTWPPAAGAHQMAYQISGASCLKAYVEKSIVGDPGTFTISAGDFETYTGKEAESCQVTLTVTRTLTTNACCSAEFGHPSRAIGKQVRVVKFNSIP